MGDSDDWGHDYSEEHESYHTEEFGGPDPYLAPGHTHTRPPAPETFPHADPAMRLLFEKVRRLENEQQCNHQPLWAKPRPGPFTERILNYHQEKEIQPLRIAFYTGTEDPITHIHSFQSALGCKGLTDEGMCLLFPSTLSGATLNWFYRLSPRTINTFDSLKQAFLDHFMIQTDRLYSADDLYMLRQGEDEPLWEYAARFSHEYSRCPETDDRATFGAFKSGLRESNFRYLVHTRPGHPDITLSLIPHLLQHPTQPRLNILLPLQVPRVPSTPSGRITTSIPSTIASGADITTTTSPAGATHTGQVKYAVVAVDYFTKWAEAEALATITAARIETFVWQNIVCRFGIPNAIVTDNGRQFDSAKFKQFCSNLKIKLCFASPAHPQSNGQVEAVNKIIKKTLKTKLDKAKGCWPELLPEVLWAYRTTFRTSTGETPFSLSFGTEAVAPVEIGQPTYRTSTYEAEANNEQLALNLDFIDELCD
ncbi:unnamed protein product [Prunus armeniaca]